MREKQLGSKKREVRIRGFWAKAPAEWRSGRDGKGDKKGKQGRKKIRNITVEVSKVEA